MDQQKLILIKERLADIVNDHRVDEMIFIININGHVAAGFAAIDEKNISINMYNLYEIINEWLTKECNAKGDEQVTAVYRKDS